MTTSNSRFLLAELVILLAVHSIAAGEPNLPQDDGSAVAEDLSLSTDERIVSEIERVGSEWMAQKRGRRVSELVGQLGRKRCVLKGKKGAARPNLDLYEDLRKSVVVVASLIDCGHCERLHASCAGGFLISDRGEFVTNYHVVDQPDAELLIVRTWDGRHYPIAEVMAANRGDDVAILRLDTSVDEAGDVGLFVPAPLGSPARVGSDAWVLSHPDHHFYMLTKGIVSRYHRQLFDGVLSDQMDITADYAMGSSGCPVLSTAGEVIGVVSTTETIFYFGGPDPSDTASDTDLGDGGYGAYDDSPQMVIKSCVPVADINKLLKAP